MSDAQALGAQLRRQGYAVLPGLYDAATVARMRTAVAALYVQLGAPETWSQVPYWPTESVEISGTGLVMHRLLGAVPHLQDGLVHPTALAVLQTALGPDLYLEFVASLVCDRSRPFFDWHHHAGGVDDELFRRQGKLPDERPVERVSMIIYLDSLEPGAGQLLIDTQRRIGPAPFATDEPDWPDHVAVSGPPGTVALFDQGQWHAVTPRTHDGLRIFVGMWFAARNSPRAQTVDTSLDALQVTDPLVYQVVGHRPQGAAA